MIVLAATLHGATSVSQFGITWTFSADHQVGQYANGDFWVVGPVTITGISPASTYTPTKTATVTISQASPAVVTWTAHASTNHTVKFTTTGTLPAPLVPGQTYFIMATGATANTFRISATSGGAAVATTTAGSGTHTAEIGRTINGTMINPPSQFGQIQGFDSAMYAQYGPSFDPGLNASRPSGSDLTAGNPLVVPAGSSLVSSISAAIASITSGVRPQLTDAAILTVVSAAPAAGAFRPSPYGSNKTHSWNKASLDYSFLRSLAPVTGTPSLTAMETTFLRPWLFFHCGANCQYISPINGNPSGTSGFYGREMSQRVADGILSLHLNYTNPQKETLYIRLVQLGIDLYGAVTFSTGTFQDLAGINNGRKLPILFAGLALGDSNLLTAVDPTVNFKFSEDRQTFYVQQSDVGRVLYHADGRPRVEYIQADADANGGNGIAEYGEQHIRSPNRDGRNWSSMIYRDVVGTSYAGMALAAHLTPGAVAGWKWPAFFDYVDRYFTDPLLTTAFHRNMWTAYRALGAPPTVVAPTSAQVNINVTP
jgi:hypothetical protein